MGNRASNHEEISAFLSEFEYQQKNFSIQYDYPQRKVFKAAKKRNQISHSSNRRCSQNIKKSLEYKVEGNHYIQLKQYKKAIESYTQAINLYDRDSIYFSNRSVANKLLNRFQEAKQDAEKALKIDEHNSRAHFIYGTIILIEVQMFPDTTESLIKQAQLGIKELESAQDQVKISKNEQKNKLRVLINQNLAKGKRMIYLIRQEIDKRNIQSLKQTLLDISHRQQLQLDWNLIEQNIKRKIEIQMPEYFVCPILFEIMEEPILLNSGLSYDKSSIQQQFRQNGYIDPLTRQSIDPLSLIENIQLRNGIIEIKREYGWIGIEHEKDYKAIRFE
ncbi:unnamed protein product [Paramecium pentaurelia]|uniref:RING-type E3 ubiquitin transferase n=1 Tax=Paramecium pentaurelia TaxID=43138 RepID=A0A8S1WR67_9CILI|nr:unnamed protein product [Paramecium pentaurelia]